MIIIKPLDFKYSVFLVVLGLVSTPVALSGEGLESVSVFADESISDDLSSSVLEQQQPTPLVSSNRSFKVQVLWQPTEIKPNQIVTFDIKFLNYITNKQVPNVYYDFMITKDDQMIKELRKSFAINGVAAHTVEFPSSGSFSVKINILGAGEFAGGNKEYVAFDLKVVPEYPLSSVIVMASVVGIMIALTKFTSMSRKYGQLK